jgi:hypothetical protein
VPDSDKGKQAPKDAAESKAETQEDEEPTYHVDRLIRDSRGFFGHPPHVLAGALHGSKKNFTLAEARERIDDFLDHKVED